MIADGESCTEVADWLNEQDTGKTHKGQAVKWWPVTVARMIRHRAYMGYAESADGMHTVKCEKLVGAGLWERANAALSHVPGKPKRGPNKNKPAMLKGAAFCAACGGTMLRLVSTHNDRPPSTSRCLIFDVTAYRATARPASAPSPRRLWHRWTWPTPRGQVHFHRAVRRGDRGALAGARQELR